MKNLFKKFYCFSSSYVLLFGIILFSHPDACANDILFTQIEFNVKKGCDLFLSYPRNIVSFQQVLIENSKRDTIVTISIESQLPFIIFNTNKGQTPYLVFPGINYSCNIEQSNQIQFFLKTADPLKQFESNALNLIQEKSSPLALNTDIKSLKYINSQSNYNINIDRLFFSKYSNQVKFLDHYLLNKLISDKGYDYLHAYLYFNYLGNRLLPFTSKQFAGKIIPKWHLNILEQIKDKVTDVKYLRLYTFQKTLINSIRFNTVTDFKNQELKNLLLSTNDLKSIETREFITYQFLNTYSNNNDTLYVSYLKNIDKFITNDLYKEILKRKLDYISNYKKKESDSFLTTDDKSLKLENIINETSGIVYVDLWASWCLPCINEMPLLSKLESNSKNEKFEVIYFSIDQIKANWVIKSKELNLNKNYLLVKNIESKLSKEISLTTIPRFLLYKNGKLINANTYQPDDARLIPYLESIINKNK